jgi:tetratricopeptide (TPR) repeat protein
MKRISRVFVLLSIAAVLAVHAGGAGEGKISFLDDWGATLNRAKSEDRLVMVEFYTSWCVFCGKFEKETLGDPRVLEMSKEFVCARLDADVQKAAATRYQPEGYPTVVFATPGGEEIVRVSGFREADPFVTVMRTVRERGREISDHMKTLEDNPKDFAAREALGSIYLDLGLGDKAVEHLRAAMKAKNLEQGDRNRLQFHMGRAAAAEDDYRKAIKILQKLLDSDPDGENAPTYLAELARTYESSGKDKKARELFDEIARRFPESTEARTFALNE